MSYSKLLEGLWVPAIAVSISVPLPLSPRSRPQQAQSGSTQTSQQDQSQAQKKDQKNKRDSAADKNAKPADTNSSDSKPAPLFGGTLNVKSSRQTKDTATLGFNGVDDNGQVQKSFLSASASGQDVSAVQRMAGTAVNPADLQEFIQQGGLNTTPPPKKASN